MDNNQRLALAVRAWREHNPDGLVGRMIALQQRNPQWARALAAYADAYAARSGRSLGWSEDVATWPEPDEPPYRPCSACGGAGYILVACDWYDPRLEQWQPGERVEPCPDCGR